MSKVTITHIVNPVKIGPVSDLHKAQPITFETMRLAKDVAKEIVNVNLITTQYPEDRSIIPSYFTVTEDLIRSVLDVGTFKKQRKLPLIKDILDAAVAHDKTADYIIYTNVDISLLPHFYLFVNEKITEGHDAFIINRRTIASHHEIHNLGAAFSDIGIEHVGYDCFVLKKELVSKLQLGTVSIGANWIGRTMYGNMVALSTKMKVFKHEHVTFHIGEDGAWLVNDFSEFDIHNKKELYTIYDALHKHTTTVSKIEILEELKEFMDRYEIQHTKKVIEEKPPYNPSNWTKFKKKVKTILGLRKQ